MSKFFSFAKFSFACSSLIILTACQQQPEPQPAKAQLDSAQTQHDAVDLTLLCQKLEKNMMEINAQRTTFALEQINQDLKVCLPLQNLAKQKQLLQHANTMYKNFLHVKRTSAQQLAFEQYAFDMAQHPTIHQSHFEQLTLRDQYLLKHQGQAYIELVDPTTTAIHYQRSSEYLGKIFAPYMPEAERVFIENLALQNAEKAYAGQNLLIEPFEISRRALFWEDYVHQYPQSSYRQDAQYLLYQYKVFLFKGLKNTPVSGHYSDPIDVQVSTIEELKKIAQLQNSTLATQAKNFLQFLDFSPEQRAQLTGGLDTLGPWQQLEIYLNLRNPLPNYKKDCFSDGICLPSK